MGLQYHVAQFERGPEDVDKCHLPVGVIDPVGCVIVVKCPQEQEFLFLLWLWQSEEAVSRRLPLETKRVYPLLLECSQGSAGMTAGPEL